MRNNKRIYDKKNFINYKFGFDCQPLIARSCYLSFMKVVVCLYFVVLKKETAMKIYTPVDNFGALS